MPTRRNPIGDRERLSEKTPLVQGDAIVRTCTKDTKCKKSAEMSDSSVRMVTAGDFASFSDILVETAIDPIVENTAAEMGYRAALTANTLARTEFEAEASADASIVISCTDNEFLSASLTRQAVMSLRGADVRPQTDGLFAGIIHPFAAFDLNSMGRNLTISVEPQVVYLDNTEERLAC